VAGNKIANEWTVPVKVRNVWVRKSSGLSQEVAYYFAKIAST